MIIIMMFLYIGGVVCYIQLFRVLTKARIECLRAIDIKVPMLKEIIRRYTDCVNGGIKVESIGLFVERIVYRSRIGGITVRSLMRIPFMCEVGIVVSGIIAIVLELSVESGLFYSAVILISLISIEASRQIVDDTYLVRLLVVDMADYLENVLQVESAGEIPVIRMSNRSSREFARLNKQYRQILKKC